MKAKIYIGAKKYTLYIGKRVLEKTLEFLTLPARFLSRKIQELKNLSIYGNSKQDILPDGYTQLEYIETTGTQYIDTGIYGELESELKFVGQVTKYYAGGNYGHLWGDLSDNTRALTFSTTKSTTASTTSRFGNKATSITTSPVRMIPLNETVTIIENKEKATSSNGIEIIFNATDEFTTNKTLTLFGANGSSGMTTARHNYRCQYFSHKKNGVLVQELIPAKRNSDDEIGMYDTVNNRFLTNDGTDTFVAGNVAPNPTTPIEIESVGDRTKNLFDIHSNDILWATNISEDGTVVSSAYNSASAFIACKPNTTYTISFTSGSTSSVTRYHAYNKNKEWVQQLTSLTTRSSEKQTVIFTTTNDTDYIRFTFRGVNSQSEDLQSDTQLEEGSIATPYEPYGYKIPVTIGDTTTNIYLSEPLRKIGEYTDTLSVDGTDVTITRNVRQDKLSSNSNWQSSPNRFYLQNEGIPSLLPSIEEGYTGANLLCSHYSFDTYIRAGSETKLNTFNAWSSAETANKFLRFGTDMSLEEFKTFLDTNDVIVTYPLATSTTETYTIDTPISLSQGITIIDTDTSVKPSKLVITGDIDNE